MLDATCFDGAAAGARVAGDQNTTRGVTRAAGYTIACEFGGAS